MAQDPLDLDDYRLLRVLGEGGMGVVYLAQQRSLLREVAVKVVRPGLHLSAAAIVRLRREAEAIARLNHPHVVRVLAFGSARGHHYVAMELVPGQGLDQRVAGHAAAPVTVAEALRWGAQLAQALAAAHSVGVVHRDVKPANVRITPEGDAVLLDFGLARCLEDPGITRPGQFQGTPNYASPEQVMAGPEPVGPSSDVYSLGVTLYESLTGRLPYSAADTERLFQQIRAGDLIPPRRVRRGIPRDLETVVLKAMARTPAERYPSAQALAADLRAVQEFRPILARPPRFLDRMVKRARRRPARTAAAIVLLLSLLALASALLITDLLREAEEQRRVAALLGLAAARLEELSSATAAAGALTPRVEHARTRGVLGAPEPAAEAEWLELEAQLARAEHAARNAADEALVLLHDAERIRAGHPDVLAALADLYMAQWRSTDPVAQARAAEDLAAFVRSHDAPGRYREELLGLGQLVLSSEPPGAEVFLFRTRRQADLDPEGTARLVPVPLTGDTSPVAPGSHVLRVVAAPAAQDRIDHGDLILEIAGAPVDETAHVVGNDAHVVGRLVAVDGVIPESFAEAVSLEHALNEQDTPAVKTFTLEHGGARRELTGTGLSDHGLRLVDARGLAELGQVPAVVWRPGGKVAMQLPAGLVVRGTLAPLGLGPASRAGPTPLRMRLAAGSYLALLRRPGHIDQRVSLTIARGAECVRSVPLAAVADTLPGFVRIADQDEVFWIQEHEVTSREYLEFLNEPAIQARIAGSRTVILCPRWRSQQGEAPAWPRAEDGTFGLPDAWPADFPVCAISWRDAEDYAAWRTTRAGSWRFSLPTSRQWLCAARGAEPRTFVQGDEFRPRWNKGRFTHREIDLAPVMTMAGDESVLGVFDLGGNATEWTRDWFDQGNGLRQLRGGSFSDRRRGAFRLDQLRGFGASGPEPAIGFRLVATRGDR